ncbi:alginate lyase family protein [Opitutales bacterium]|nr:alginate lyase family protein [Opitutales bacterium]
MIPNFEVSKSWMDRGLWFSFHEFEINGIPDWHANPFKKGVRAVDDTAWHKISDFNDKVGDIKTVWEASRFDWVLAMAQRIASGDENELDRLNNWLQDWIIKNPPYMGVNWKCGQEASIRVMHLAMATIILEQSDTPSEFLKRFIFIHLQRIKPTTSYAIAQCNNHATSEAAALFIGGILIGGKTGEKLSCFGRKLLETQVERLVGEDGSFSQYSLNYHRVFLDTMCMVEIWRQKKGEKEFSSALYSKAKAASTWLFNLIDLANGEGPNVGANDGARLFPINNTKYRDNRPTVQMAYNLFYNERAIEAKGSWDDGLKWMELPEYNKSATQKSSFIADQGGFAVLRNNKAWVLLKYPRYKFRPSHADALHVDFWVNGLNLLRDGGSYSYNTEENWLNYFSGTESHNTIMFDDKEQMPKVSRFLFGDWLKTSRIQPLKESDGFTSYGSGYEAHSSLSHFRSLSLSGQELKVLDQINGFRHKAILRWRLPLGEWSINNESNEICLSNSEFKGFSLSVSVGGNVTFARVEVVGGWESSHYLDKTEISVLEVEVTKSCSLTTIIQGFDD